MRTLHISLIAAMVLVGASVPGFARVEVGSTEWQVIDELGHPEFKYSRKGTEYYSYYGLELELQDGKVTKVPFGLSQEIAKRSGARQKQQELAKRRIIKQTIINPEPRNALGRSMRVISNGGREVDVKRYVGRGKVTVVDFYADWCGPCRKVAPRLEKMARADPDVNLVKIDIVKWGTPVAKQYAVKNVPNIRVYDRSGKMVGKPTHDFGKIAKYVAKAK